MADEATPTKEQKPADFCSYFLQQLEGGTVIVPVTPHGDAAFTVFQFENRRYKITVAEVKRVRMPKEAKPEAAPAEPAQQEIVPPGAGEDVT